jgi:hypothetical protein
MRARMIVAGLVLAGVAACNRELGERTGSASLRRELSKDMASPAPAGAPATANRDAGETASLGLGAATEDGKAGELPLDRPGSDAADRMIIRTGQASLEVDSLELGIGAIRRLAGTLGGYVANASLQGGRDQIRQAMLEIKVPAERFDDLTAGLEPVGRLEFVNVAAQDVGEEYVDLTARATNARRLEERLLDILATRTGKLQDVLSVEREVARVREEIERIDGRLRYLRTRASLSTLSVTVHEPPPIIANPGRNPVAEAFREAWRNFVSVVAGSIALLGYAVPVAALVWTAIFLGRRVRRQAA